MQACRLRSQLETDVIHSNISLNQAFYICMVYSNKSKLKLVDKTCFVSDDAIITKQSNKLNNCKLEDKTLYTAVTLI